MKRKLSWMGLALICGCLATWLSLVSTVRAEDDPDEGNDSTAIAAKLEMAHRLAEMGKKTGDPSALVSAGVLLLQMPKARPITEKPQSTSEDAKTEKSDDFKAQADKLFAAALELSSEKAAGDVKKLIDDAKKNFPIPLKGTKGNLEGPKTIRRNLPKGVVDTWQFAFEAKQPAYVAVQGDYKLHIEVIRPSGEHVCDVNFPSASVNFTPPNSAKWTIKISNISGRSNSYMLTTN